MGDLASLSNAAASIHQEVDFSARPERIYDALLDARQFSAFTGAPAQITPEEGASFSLFGGRVTGRNVELVPGQRIVQAWRIAAWPAGVYAILKFELVARGAGTRLVLDEAGFPPEDGPAHRDNWSQVYWRPLHAFLDHQGGVVSTSESTPADAAPRGAYERQVHFAALPETVFEALTTLSGLAGWWAPVTGSGAEGGELRFTFSTDDPVVLHVDAARPPTTVVWRVQSSEFAPMMEWVGTTIAFALRRSDAGGCDLQFRHEGLTPDLHCYGECSVGWDFVLASLRSFVDTGKGNPIQRGSLAASADAPGA